jgi:integrase
MRNAHGSIQPAGEGVWRVFVEVGRDSTTGKRRRTSKTVRGSKKRAADVLSAMLAECGETDSARDMTLDAFWGEIYAPRCAERLRPVTVEGYRRNYAAYIQKPLGALSLRRITPAVVDGWLGRIDGAKKRLQAYKMLRQILNKAVRLNLIRYNPCANVEVPKVPRYRPEVLSAEDAAAYLEHFRGAAIEPAVLVAIGAGLRRSEICALDWGDVKEGRVSVRKAVTSVAGRPHEDLPKSDFGVRDVVLPPFIAARLDELRGEDDAPLVPDTTGGRMNPDNVTHAYRKALETLPQGVARVPLKNLRHTSLTLALEGGADLLAVSRRAGHSTTSITARYYLRPHESVDKAAAQGLGALLQGEAE